MMELYKHNQEAYENMEEMFEYEDKVAIVHPTGTGKMYIIVKWLYENRNKKCLFLCPTNAVMYQLKETIEDNGLSLNDFPNLDLALYSHLLNWNTEDYENQYDCIVLDEFHRAGAKEWGRCVNTLLEYNEGKVLGLSATPIRYMDKRNMVDEIFEGNIASEITLSEAIANNILPFPHYVGCVYYLKEEINKREEMINECEDDKKRKYLQNLLEQAKRHLENAEGMNEIIEEHIKEPGKYIVFCKDINHIKEMKEEVKSWFRNIGEVKEYIVHSEIEKEENQQTLKRFEKEDGCQLLFAVDMLNEGLHVKGVDGVLMLRTTESHIIYLQQLGRCLSVKGKIPKVIDVANNIEAYENIYDVRDEILEYLGYEGYNDERIPKEIKERFKIYGYTKDIVNILKQIDFMYRSVLTFDEKLKIIKEYLKDHEYLEIIQSTKYNGYNIGQWVNNWRTGRIKLIPSQEQELRELGETFERKMLTNEKKLEILKEYLKEYDYSEIVKSTKYNGYNIGLWISNWRTGATKLTPIQKQELCSLGETFENKIIKSEKLTFEKKLEIIKEYLKEHEYSEIIQSTKYNGYSIGRWINKWRIGQIKLTQIQQQELRNLGENFERRVSTNEEKIEVIKEYLKEHEYSKIVFNTKYNGYNIGKWISNWRTGATKLTLSEEQELRNLGETFERKQTERLTNEEKLEIIKEYLKEHDYSEIIQSTKYNGYSIGRWVGMWRNKQVKLTPSEEQELKELGETFSSKKRGRKLKVNKIPTGNIAIEGSMEGEIILIDNSKHR